MDSYVRSNDDDDGHSRYGLCRSSHKETVRKPYFVNKALCIISSNLKFNIRYNIINNTSLVPLKLVILERKHRVFWALWQDA